MDENYKTKQTVIQCLSRLRNKKDVLCEVTMLRKIVSPSALEKEYNL